MKTLAALLAVALAGAGCTAAPAATPAPTVEPTPVVTPAPTVAPTPTPVPVVVVPATPFPDPQPGFNTALPGEPVTITENDEPWAKITVSKVSEKSSYKGRYSSDKPAPGNTYLQVWVTYEALDDGVSYNPWDWNVFCDDLAVDGQAFIVNGPEPELGAGDLPRGRKAAGWIVYEVPKTGACVMSYDDWDGNVVFEVKVRG